MNTIKEKVRTTQTINKSEFICTLIPIKDYEDSQNKLASIRKEFYDATHNCYAIIWGENGEYSKFSDDGEPSQTAGVVIHNVLKQNELTNVLAIVTRYFGGIKLGAGGLVRAYSSSTALAVKEATITKIIKISTLEIKTNYTYINLVLKELERINARIIRKDFYEDIVLTIELPDSDIQDLKSNLIEITKGSVKINQLNTL